MSTVTVRRFVKRLLKTEQKEMQTIKTATFESLLELAEEQPEGGYLFTLDGHEYRIEDVLEISKIAQQHDYIIIY